MIVNIPYEDGDDKKFLLGINSLVAALTSEINPDDVYVVRIKKWFDHKWLRYSGMGVVDFPRGRVGFGGTFGAVSSLDEHFQDKLTFPPFNPNQVGIQGYWTRKDDGTYVGVDKPRWIYKRELAHSSDNLHRRVESFSDSGLFVWFSSYTEKNGHGCIMVYTVKDGNVETWYASLSDRTGWGIEKVKGIEKEWVQQWFPTK